MSAYSRLFRVLPLWLWLMCATFSSYAQVEEFEVVVQDTLQESSFEVDSMFNDEEPEEEVPMRQLDSVEWKKLSDQIDYSGDKFPADRKLSDKDLPKGPSWNLSSDWVKYVLFGLIAVFLVFMLFRGFYRGKGELEQEEEDLDVHILSEEKLLELNLEDLLKKAVQEGDFKMAFRLHYLLLIKILKERKYIRWQKEKTNYEYLRELRDTFAYTPFRKITAMYEMIWYGDRPVNEDIYRYFSVEMNTLSADLLRGKSTVIDQLTEAGEDSNVE